ncbi:NifB/NifX family molybdenum-iron cluster-binding protein [Magnetofaba australis]|uniref:Putative nitrogen fixation-like protein n=1 Tax=Magnetofaba australis IT-1 TaxID=1434232 RepID=A0A1Y2K804_9PROT|nr:nitrogen fixation protein [Magnetofaba australis]OSM06193.1 putative nitrogen fixation-like protein [Magnetofaba australis IT-1]
MRIAVVSDDYKQVTGKCGKARRFLIFSGEMGGEPQLMARLELAVEQPDYHDLHEDEVTPHPIDGHVMITGEAGEGITERLARRDVDVRITPETDPTTAARLYLQNALPASDPHPHNEDGTCPGDH